jgi:hypothetical protein
LLETSPSTACYSVLLATSGAAENPAELHKKGIEALKESQTNPDAIVTPHAVLRRLGAL